VVCGVHTTVRCWLAAPLPVLSVVWNISVVDSGMDFGASLHLRDSAFIECDFDHHPHHLSYASTSIG
jgi:hypothetical protein